MDKRGGWASAHSPFRLSGAFGPGEERPCAAVSTKSRWDKAILKQEFSTAQSKLTQTWDVDENGRLVLVAKVESLKLITPDQKAVFDRKQP